MSVVAASNEKKPRARSNSRRRRYYERRPPVRTSLRSQLISLIRTNTTTTNSINELNWPKTTTESSSLHDISSFSPPLDQYDSNEDDEDIIGESELVFIGGGGDEEDADQEADDESDLVDNNCYYDHESHYRPPSPVPRQLLAELNSFEPVEDTEADRTVEEDEIRFDTLVDEIERQLDESDDSTGDGYVEPKTSPQSSSTSNAGDCSCSVKCKCLCHLCYDGETDSAVVVGVRNRSSTNSNLSLNQRGSGSSPPPASLEWDVSVDLVDAFDNEKDSKPHTSSGKDPESECDSAREIFRFNFVWHVMMRVKFEKENKKNESMNELDHIRSKLIYSNSSR